jgi:Tol biopolymer transport system component
MDVRALAAAVVVGVAAGPQPPHAPLFTARQGDLWRSAIDPPSVSLSADGRFVAFASYARLAPADRNDTSDIYVLDRDTGGVTVESIAPDAAAGSPIIHAEHARISADGRYVVFESIAGLPYDLPRPEVVLRDRWSGTSRVVSAGPNGTAADAGSRSPAISADGRIVAFASAATNLVGGHDANGVGEDIYLVDVATGGVRRASVDSAGRQPASGASFDPSLSADGRYVAFTSTAFGAAAERTMCHVYVRDTQRGVTTRISAAGEGSAPNGPSAHATISGDGRYVAFVSAASNLTSDDRNRADDVFLHDRTAGSTMLISRSARRGAGNGASVNPAIAPDGRMVVFQSEASDLVCAARCPAARDDINLVWDVFVFDRRTGVMSCVSGDPGEGWMEPSSGPAIDAAGRVVAFSSRHPVDARDSAGDLDLFIRVGS